MREAYDTIAITGMGMVSCLGLDVVNSCAAARAGLSRVRPLSFQVVSPEDNELQSVNGHGIAYLTEGFEGIGRLMRIVQLGLADFLNCIEASLIGSEVCGWFMALPKQAARDQDEEESPNELAEQPQEIDSKRLTKDLQRFAGVHVKEGRAAIFREGHAGFAIAVQHAVQQLRARTLDRCVVGAADSLLDSDQLQTLLDDGRLKTADNPVGLPPGEAGAFFLLEPLTLARRRSAPVFGIIQAVYVDVEENHLHREKPAFGRGLARVIKDSSDMEDNGTAPWLISDHNGEEYRAAEWGHAMVDIAGRNSAFQGAEVLYPALAFGDTRTASGAIGLSVALRGFARAYAPSERALILSSSDDGARAALLVRAFSS